MGDLIAMTLGRCEKWAFITNSTKSQKENTFIVLNPSDSLTSRLRGLKGDLTAGDIHHAVLRAATEQWNTYIDYLEGQCEDLVSLTVSFPALFSTRLHGS
jgi:hypothetical protein